MRSTHRTVRAATIVATLAALTVAGPGASAHPTCDGRDHSHRIWDVRHLRTYVRHYDFLKTGSTWRDRAGVQWYTNVFTVRETGARSIATCKGTDS